MLFSRKVIYFPLPILYLNESPIAYNYSFKFLGLYLDFKLNWKHHIHHLRSKLSSVCGILYSIRNKITREVAKLIYYSIAYPHLNYCNIVWTSCYPTLTQSIASIQNKLIRIITKKNRWTPSAPLYHQLKVLKLADINKLNTAVFVYKSINNIVNSPIHYQYRINEGYNLCNQENIPFTANRTIYPRQRRQTLELYS